ncbi:MAG: adenylyltransferase/cytidyltransferase family protein [Elusimicrobia bacterium]|nr:adenylyltransferase/cytidyltransferase family protein [Elusimicrobiota bacterium]MBU2614552.1 adenylyltransferase/cytidyltransferase family protein [Elusimicrobiota bacterium]
MKNNKIKSRKEILAIVKKIKKRNKKVVFTNGCFDLLHAGHIRIFEKAKTLGDVLIVGVNSDKSIKELKGPKRPIVHDKYRAEIIASIQYVDYVTIFNERSVIQLVKEIHPDVLVKGGHYTVKEVVGWQYAEKVARVPVVKDSSTTNIINKITDVYGK